MYYRDFLKEFNPAIAYSFDPESSPNHDSQTLQDTYFHEAGQYQDMMAAYLYAQENLLPLIKTKSLTSTDLLEHTKRIHGFIAKTLLAPFEMHSGEFTDQFVFRWHHGASMVQEFILYLANKHSPGNTAKKFANFLLKNYKVPESDSLKFLKLIDRIKKDTSITIPDCAQKIVDKDENPESVRTLSKLYVAFNRNLLSDEDKAIVGKLCKICILPEQIMEKMNEFSDRLVKQLVQCNAEDIDEVATFAANVFYELTEIHPFANGNGRTATCLMNCVLKGLGYPDILLRYPGDARNPDSQYSKAISQIAVTRKPLADLIKARILEAQKAPYKNEKREEHMQLTIAMATLCKRIQRKYPSININNLAIESIEKWKKQFKPKLKNEIECQIGFCRDMVTAGKNLEKVYDAKKTAIPVAPELLQRQVSQAAAFIEKYSGVTGWKSSTTKGLTFWITLDSMDDVKIIAQKLQYMSNAMEVNSGMSQGRATVICHIGNNLNYLLEADQGLTDIIGKINKESVQSHLNISI